MATRGIKPGSASPARFVEAVAERAIAPQTRWTTMKELAERNQHADETATEHFALNGLATGLDTLRSYFNPSAVTMRSEDQLRREDAHKMASIYREVTHTCLSDLTRNSSTSLMHALVQPSIPYYACTGSVLTGVVVVLTDRWALARVDPLE
jgi:hypothetical protein